MSRLEEMGQREELRTRRKIIAAEITSHCDSIRHALPLVGDPEDIDGEYVMALGIKINERVQELRGVIRKIEVLEATLASRGTLWAGNTRRMSCGGRRNSTALTA